MIKINLALRKRFMVSTETKKTLFSFLDVAGLKRKLRIRSAGAPAPAPGTGFPIRQLVIASIVVGVAYFFLEGMKKEDLAKWDGLFAKETAIQVKLKADLAKTKGYESLKKQIDADERLLRTKIDTIQKLVAERDVPSKLLTSLAQGVPPDVWLTEFAMKEGGKVQIKGHSQSYDAVSNFLKNLTENTFFHDVRLGDTKQEAGSGGDSVQVFEIVAKRR